LAKPYAVQVMYVDHLSGHILVIYDVAKQQSLVAKQRKDLGGQFFTSPQLNNIKCNAEQQNGRQQFIK